MSDADKSWESYEQVAQYLLDKLAEHFGLGHVEGKQVVPGQSGTSWEIDAKGVNADGAGFLIVECRRYTKSGLAQEAIGGLAFRIHDTGARGAIVVSPLDLQAGARKVAAYSNIIHVKLSPESTTTEYLLSFLDQVFIGLADTMALSIKERLTIEVFENGVLVEKHEVQ
jgi:hypothetical protein